ncbi:hypothetical protein CYY_008470 [Polysphondylium violaceum]|uniref:Uncharacterized protein n=1 Tax=Polysphondylium violaceum TaxID=133409 RepID=A0A8J4PMZ2_9MYCE|nr:hypothetical protein CYY_008470 [Polysphondylium violaceum]
MIIKCLSSLAPGKIGGTHSSISMGSGNDAGSGLNQLAMPGSLFFKYGYIDKPDGTRQMVLIYTVTGEIVHYY